MSLLIVSTLAFVLFVAMVVAIVFAVSFKVKLAKYADIDDTNEHLKQLSEQSNELQLNISSYTKELAKCKTAYARYTEVIGICKSAAEAKQKLDQLNSQILVLEDAIGEARTARDIKEKVDKTKEELSFLRAALGES